MSKYFLIPVFFTTLFLGSVLRAENKNIRSSLDVKFNCKDGFCSAHYDITDAGWMDGLPEKVTYGKKGETGTSIEEKDLSEQNTFDLILKLTNIDLTIKNHLAAEHMLFIRRFSEELVAQEKESLCEERVIKPMFTMTSPTNENPKNAIKDHFVFEFYFLVDGVRFPAEDNYKYGAGYPEHTSRNIDAILQDLKKYCDQTRLHRSKVEFSVEDVVSGKSLPPLEKSSH